MLKAPARKVARVTALLRAQNEYEAEQMEEQRKKIEEAERKANKSNAPTRR
jgi:hypothetical protein